MSAVDYAAQSTASQEAFDSNSLFGQFDKFSTSLSAFFGGNSSEMPVRRIERIVSLNCHCVIPLSHSHLRNFHSTFTFFYPGVPKARLTAELKGSENMHPANPTTPFTERLALGLGMYAKPRHGKWQAGGLIVMLYTILRTAEAIVIRFRDVIFRSQVTLNTSRRRLFG